ncbi:MAG: hypothetical protein Q8Q12_02680 [bacterium]|nr:hypothetical protein [bacterium]
MAAELAPAAPAENKWFVEFGPFWRTGGDVDFRIKSFPALAYTPPSVAASSRVGPADAVADRTYDDGYVKCDYGTGIWDNNTWYWGYKSDSQAVGNQLVFHGSTYSARGESLQPRDRFALDLDDEVGGQAKIGRTVFTTDRTQGAIVLGLGFSSFAGSTGFEDLGYVWSAKRGTITDIYNLLTDPNMLPPAPYSGTKEGPGYVIPNIPARREIRGEAGSSPPLTQIVHSVRQEIDVDLWAVSLGFDVRGKGRVAGEKRFISYVAGAGITGNFTSADSDFRWAAMQDGVAIDSASFSGDDRTFELGAYGEAGILLRFSERVSVSLRGRYDHVLDDAEVDFANTSAEIDLSGFSVLANLGVSF